MTENEGATGCGGTGVTFGGGSISIDLALMCPRYFSLAGIHDSGLIWDSGEAIPKYVV